MPSLDGRARSTSRTMSSFSRVRSLKRSEFTFGVVLLFVVVFLWTASNFVTQGTFDGGYEKPFFVTYLNTSAFTLYLLPYALRRIRKRWGSKISIQSGGAISHYQALSTEEHTTLRPPPPSNTIINAPLTPLTEQETAKLAAIFSIFWFAANWTVNASLEYTSVASTTILSSMSGFFTLIIGRTLGVESFTLAKVFAVVTSFTGVALVSLSDSTGSGVSIPVPGTDLPTLTPDHRNRPILGDTLALLSALFYALYVTLLKVRVQDERRLDARLFFGLVGLINILTLWPIGIVFHVLGIERFELPHGRKIIGAILLNMVFTISSDYLYIVAMLKTTPLLVTVGLSLTIPLAVMADWFLLARSATGQVVIGAVLVIVSFVVLGFADAKAESSEGSEDNIEVVYE